MRLLLLLLLLLLLPPPPPPPLLLPLLVLVLLVLVLVLVLVLALVLVLLVLILLVLVLLALVQRRSRRCWVRFVQDVPDTARNNKRERHCKQTRIRPAHDGSGNDCERSRPNARSQRHGVRLGGGVCSGAVVRSLLFA
jgi:hypothetical protein